MYRYIAVLWSRMGARPHSVDRILARIEATLPDMRAVLHCDGLAVYCADLSPGSYAAYRLGKQGGVVVGKLFTKQLTEGELPQRVEISDDSAAAITQTRGARLLHDYWGRYVAFMLDDAAKAAHILRDPSGAIPAYTHTHEGVVLVFSQTEDLLALNLTAFTINWRYVHASLFGRPLHASSTGMQEIQQIRQGERVTIGADGQQSRVLAWHPYSISETQPIEHFDEAVEQARSTIRACLGAWASCYPNILLTFSAGFDSTVVLSSLRRAPSRPRITCLHYFDGPANAQDQEYLHRTLRGTAFSSEQIELMEVERAPESIRLEQRLANVPRFACLPYYKGWLTNEHLGNDPARERGATIFTGTYGDELFLTDRIAGAVDYLWRHPDGEQTLATTEDLLRHQQTLWSAMANVLRYNLTGDAPPIKLTSEDYPLLNAAVLADMESHREEYFRRYWLQSPVSMPPGKRRHISLMCMPADRNHPFWRPGEPERVLPLISQPLMELFLRIPTYVLVKGTLDRTVVRKAFWEQLPQELHTRSMVEIGRRRPQFQEHRAVFRENEAFICETLLEGVLAREGLIDRNALERYLQEFRAGRVLPYTDVFEDYFDLEIWLRSWREKAGRQSLPRA